MIYLQRMLINLRSANLRIIGEYLDGDEILFHHDGVAYSYDVQTGVTTQRSWDRGGLEQTVQDWITNQPSGKASDAAGCQAIWQRLSDGQKVSIFESSLGHYKSEEVCSWALAFINSIASQQVKADDLIKGLQAIGYSLPQGTRLMKLFIGGYTFTDEEGYYWQLEQLCYHIFGKLG